MSDTFRLGQDHATDIRAVMRDLKRRFPDAKIFLVGTSRGTISAAALGASLGDVVQGVVLSSTITNPDRMGAGLSTFDFGSIKVPVLLVHHRDDGCRTSPYSGVERLAKSFRWSASAVAIRRRPSLASPCRRTDTLVAKCRRRRRSGTGCSAASSRGTSIDDVACAVDTLLPDPIGAAMSAIEVKVPDIGDFTDVPVIEILVKPGDTVKVEDSLVTLESDKATMDVPSPAAGVVKALDVKLGDKVSEGTLILTLETTAAAAPAPRHAAPAASAAKPPRPQAAKPAPSPHAARAEAAPRLRCTRPNRHRMRHGRARGRARAVTAPRFAPPTSA